MGHSNTKQVLIVDEHPAVRQGLSHAISCHPDFAVTGEARDVAGAVEQMENRTPDLAVIDVSARRRDGLDLIRGIKSAQPGVKIVVVSMHSSARLVERALDAGAAGFVDTAESADELLRTLQEVAGGRITVSRRVALRLSRRAGSHPTGTVKFRRERIGP